jgi:hypothetical protein
MAYPVRTFVKIPLIIARYSAHTCVIGLMRVCGCLYTEAFLILGTAAMALEESDRDVQAMLARMRDLSRNRSYVSW